MVSGVEDIHSILLHTSKLGGYTLRGPHLSVTEKILKSIGKLEEAAGAVEQIDSHYRAVELQNYNHTDSNGMAVEPQNFTI